MRKNTDFQWFAYRHTTGFKLGEVIVKRYFSPMDIIEARESAFCHRVTASYVADGRVDALRIGRAILRGEA